MPSHFTSNSQSSWEKGDLQTFASMGSVFHKGHLGLPIVQHLAETIQHGRCTFLQDTLRSHCTPAGASGPYLIPSLGVGLIRGNVPDVVVCQLNDPGQLEEW